jgi:hypothetical protein
MRKIEAKTEGQYLYVGAFDLSDKNKDVIVYTNEKVVFNIQNAVSTIQNLEEKITLKDLKLICKESNIKANIYPSGNIGFSKLDSSDDELKTCYLSTVSTIIANYIICIAFEETQPMLYKAQLVSVFLVESKI